MDAKILVIDDDPVDQKIIGRYFKKAEFLKTSFCDTGEEGVDFARDNKLDIVFVDTNLPGINGFETCRRIKKVFGKELKVVVMTGAVDAVNARKAREAGADEYCAKTEDSAPLIEVLKGLYGNSQNIGEEASNIISVDEKDVEKIILKRTEEALCAQLKAERSNRAKSEFLANMSHELRTPLHGILSFAELGRERFERYKKDEPEKFLDFFQKIETSGQVLLRLLNDLLDLSKLEAGKMEFHFKPVRLWPQVLNVVSSFETLLAQKQVSINVNPTSFQEQIQIDSYKIDQVLRNLLSNAVKFSPQDSVIEIELLKKENTVQMVVSDQGEGIPEEELGMVFDKFVQSSKTNTGAGGTGLGLPICREIVTAHKGCIWAENNNSGGARFIVELPV